MNSLLKLPILYETSQDVNSIIEEMNEKINKMLPEESVVSTSCHSIIIAGHVAVLYVETMLLLEAF